MRSWAMEAYFDELQEGLLRSAVDKEKLKALTEYYEDGRWLSDYTLDEWGCLPPCLKRGVLSQDGVYNLLEKLKNENLM